MQSPACAREPGHHGAHRNPGHLAYFPVRHLLDLAQDDDLPELSRQRVDRCAQHLVFGTRNDGGIRTRRGVRDSVLLIVILDSECVPAPAGSPRVAAVPDDREQPRPGIEHDERVVMAERTKERLLHDVLRVVIVPHEVARKCVRVVQEWQDGALELCGRDGCGSWGQMGKERTASLYGLLAQGGYSPPASGPPPWE